jgi:serine protease
LRVRRQSAGLAALTWRDNSTNETGFEIERQRRSGSTWIETTTLTTAANAVSTTNNAGIGTFRYRIRARNGTAASAWTAYVSITL